MSAKFDETVSRRGFLLSTGSLLGGAWLAAEWPVIAHAAHQAQAAAASGGPDAFKHFTREEAATVDAIAAQIVPSGATPGAREAHAVYFMDLAFGSFFAGMAQDYRAGLATFEAAFRETHPAFAGFAAADNETQIAHLMTVDRTPFFETTRFLTVLGMFSSPKYGGNFDAAGWKLLGFEDQHAFAPPFGYYDREYPGFMPYDKAPS
jgi:gluconate 2-dehydrogenase gamma chain